MPEPRYPVFVVSKGRPASLTASFLERDRCPFRIVVEPPDEEAYRDRWGDDVMTLPFQDLGQGSIPARNWIWERALKEGAERHWILDDNIREIRRSYRGRRIPCAAGPALAAVEDFADRYENVAIAGLAYQMFGFGQPGHPPPPFQLNVHVYSTMLINTGLPQRWRGRYNEDTDLCLQVLSAGWCTVQVNVFCAGKVRTGATAGGNSEIYGGDGRLRMARELQRRWPHIVSVDRRFGRPQHVVRDQWRRFDTPLRRKPDADLPPRAADDEYGLRLRAVKPVAAESLRRLVDDA